jgi:adenine-specific DNA-methyltransferase
MVIDGRIYFGKDENTVPKVKKYLKEMETELPSSVFYRDGRGASAELEMLLGQKKFNNPKDRNEIARVLNFRFNATVLDFFAGSGTTLHSTMQLNAEDGGNRQCILVTNNENNICDEVTYERNKRVIQGYTTDKGVAVEGLSNNNLRYFRSENLSREPSLKNKRELTQLATELLCIKEDCYTEQKIKIKQAKLFANARVTLLILFDDHVIPDAVELVKGMDAKEIKVYVFSMGSDPYTEDFAEVLDKVTLCALPDAIYKAYQSVLPKKKRTVPLMEEVTEITTSENGEQLSIL